MAECEEVRSNDARTRTVYVLPKPDGVLANLEDDVLKQAFELANTSDWGVPDLETGLAKALAELADRYAVQFVLRIAPDDRIVRSTTVPFSTGLGLG